MDLSAEFAAAERVYNLTAFDNDPAMCYELLVRLCDAHEERTIIRQTFSEIKREIALLTPGAITTLYLVAYSDDDNRPTPAYLIISKQ